MYEEVKVSIIIPAYNVEKYVAKCLDSILNQSYQNYEIIVVNDGSKDNTLNILEKYSIMFNGKMRIISQSNQGQSSARNNGMEYVTGKYILFIDADDYILNDYIEVLLTNAENNSADLVICSYKKVLNDDTIVVTRNSKEWDIEFSHGLSHVFQYSPCAKIYRTDLLKSNDIKFGVGEKLEDGPFGIITSSIAKNVVVLDYYGYLYRKYDESTMGKIRSKGIAENIPELQFPYKGLEEAIRKVIKIRGKEYFQVLEYVIFKALAGYAFEFSKKSSSDTLKFICDYSDRIIKTYFKEYKKNPYLKINGVHKLSFVHRMAVWLFKTTYSLHILYPFAKVYNILSNYISN